MSLPEQKPAIRVMIVDDSSFMRKAIERILSTAGDIIVCASVPSGELALEQVDIAKPDIITMDVEMPGMGGLSTVKAMIAHHRIPIIMLSSLTSRGSETTLQALENGAVDFIAKPSGGVMDIHRITSELIAKVRAFARHAPLPPARRQDQDQSHLPVFVATAHRAVRCIAIGISTGGPAALSTICNALTAKIRVPIIIVQHMPRGFTKALADRLNGHCALEVIEATDQMAVRPGQIVIGPSGQQMRIKPVGDAITICLSESKGESLYTPSADVLFSSLSESYGRSGVAFILTGMGNDGTQGLKLFKAAGGYVYGQDEASCAVYGMPRAAASAGLVDTVLPLSSVAAAIEAAAQGRVV